jgi:hypothetical protein
MEKRFTVEVDMFASIIEVYVGYDYEKLMTYFDGLGFIVEEDDRKDDGAKGIFIGLDHKEKYTVKVLWLRKWDGELEDIGVLSHECVHAAQYILDDCGIPVDWAGTEAVAYFQEWLLKKVCRELGYESLKGV